MSPWYLNSEKENCTLMYAAWAINRMNLCSGSAVVLWESQICGGMAPRTGFWGRTGLSMGRWEGQGGSAFEQRGLMESFPAHVRGAGIRQALRSPSNPNYFMRRRNLPFGERPAVVR